MTVECCECPREVDLEEGDDKNARWLCELCYEENLKWKGKDEEKDLEDQ